MKETEIEIDPLMSIRAFLRSEIKKNPEKTPDELKIASKCFLNIFNYYRFEWMICSRSDSIMNSKICEIFDLKAVSVADTFEVTKWKNHNYLCVDNFENIPPQDGTIFCSEEDFKNIKYRTFRIMEEPKGLGMNICEGIPDMINLETFTLRIRLHFLLPKGLFWIAKEK